MANEYEKIKMEVIKKEPCGQQGWFRTFNKWMGSEQAAYMVGVLAIISLIVSILK